MMQLLRHKDKEPPAHEAVPHPGAGWFEDPFEIGKLRWFDGHRWTDRVIDEQPEAEPTAQRPEAARPAQLHSLGEGKARVADLLSGVRRPDER